MNTIEKQIELNAPISRVWKALTDYKEFATWFETELDEPFVVGQTTYGKSSCEGHEGIKISFSVVKMEPEHSFSYMWHPYSVEPQRDYSQEEPNLVAFTLTETATGTLLKVVESGFDRIPAERRDVAFEKHTNGWEAQLKNIQDYVSENR